jgi:polyhydroxyalkanoate synthesis regulator phasin
VDRHAPDATLSNAVTPPPNSEQSGISEALRKAVEATFSATAGSAGETRERAAELLDEVARRGRDARAEVARRGQEAREEVYKRGQVARDEVARRGQDAREEVARRSQEAREEVVARVETELHSISERLAKLEAAIRGDKG